MSILVTFNDYISREVRWESFVQLRSNLSRCFFGEGEELLHKELKCISFSDDYIFFIFSFNIFFVHAGISILVLFYTYFSYDYQFSIFLLFLAL